MMKTLKLCAAVAAATMITMPVFGADYPSKPIKLIVTAGPGGGEDTEARAIAPFVEKYLKTQITIENQGGAGGKIAFEKFQGAAPDGYTLITYTFPKSIIIEHQGKTGFKTKDFTPIFAWSESSQILIVNAESPWKTFPEFLKAAKAKPLSGGLSGRGSTTHLMGLIALEALNIDKVNWVPYPGSSGSVAALAGKHLDFTMSLATSAVPLIRAGKLRPLLLFSENRDPNLRLQDEFRPDAARRRSTAQHACRDHQGSGRRFPEGEQGTGLHRHREEAQDGANRRWCPGIRQGRGQRVSEHRKVPRDFEEIVSRLNLIGAPEISFRGVFVYGIPIPALARIPSCFSFATCWL